MSGYTDEFGDYHEDSPNFGIFRSDSKLQGIATLGVSPLIPVQVPIPGTFPAINMWPMVKQDQPAWAMAQTLITVNTVDALPHIVSMAFGLSGIPDAGTGGFTEVVGVFELGIGGSAYWAEVDVLQGAQFSFAVNRLQAHFVYRLIPGGLGVPRPPPTYGIGVSLSSGVIAHGRQPQRTLAHGGDAATPALAVAAAEEFWQVPAFAKSFRVIANPENSQMYIRAYPVGLGAAPCAIYPIAAPATQDYPLPTDAAYIGVQNVSLVNAVQSYRLIFELAL